MAEFARDPPADGVTGSVIGHLPASSTLVFPRHSHGRCLAVGRYRPMTAQSKPVSGCSQWCRFACSSPGPAQRRVRWGTRWRQVSDRRLRSTAWAIRVWSVMMSTTSVTRPRAVLPPRVPSPAPPVRHRSMSIDTMIRPDIPGFDPGEDAVPEPAPRRPVQRDGGLLGWARRRREFHEATDRYGTEEARYRQRELDRRQRLTRRRAEYDEQVRELRAMAQRRAHELKHAVNSQEEGAVEAFAAAAVSSLPMPDGINLAPRIAYRPPPRELVVDIQLPDTDVVPSEEPITYVHTRKRFKTKERARADTARIYLRVIAQLPLAVVNALFKTFEADLLDSVTVNGVRSVVDPATGRAEVRYQVSVTTSRSTFDGRP